MLPRLGKRKKRGSPGLQGDKGTHRQKKGWGKGENSEDLRRHINISAKEKKR